MLLKSSSTPVLGSLLSSFSENPKKNSFNQASGSQNFTTFSCNSSPISPSVAEFSGIRRCSNNGFRRVHSEGNLEGFGDASYNTDEFSLSNTSKKCSRRPNSSMLPTIPSFSFHNSRSRDEDEDSDEENEIEEFEEKDVRGGERFEATEVNGGLSVLKKRNMGLDDEIRYVSEYGNVGFDLEERAEISTHMYLAKGLGVTGAETGFGVGGGCGGGRDFTTVAFFGDGGNSNGLEEHYKRMVEENPGNPLFLRNYAQFLYLSKKDLQGAEEYYSRAILADPKDGEILSQYAKLVWELHSDKDRATSYFERAVQAASEDSHVHAAYANFLWETEEDEDEEDDAPNVPNAILPLLHKDAMATTTA